LLRGGLELSQWKQQTGAGDVPSVDQVYTPATLPGLGTQPVYWHSQGTIGVDSRPARGYARRGAFYGVTIHDFTDPDARAGFNQVDYEAIQHIPILRDTWVVSLHGWAQTTYQKEGQQVPFFMMPSIGGGSDLRAYASWRLRDLNSLVLQAEWRVMVNRYLDMALFYDAGKVAAKRTDLTLTNMKDDVGLGFRLHGQLATPLRIEFTHGSEGFGLVLSASQAF
jgi:outer membrane protein assembly factor BamA